MSGQPNPKLMQECLLERARLESAAGLHGLAMDYVHGAATFGPWMTTELAESAERIEERYIRWRFRKTG